MEPTPLPASHTRTPWLLLAVLAMCLAGTRQSAAHGTHEELLTELSHQLKTQPDNAELYFRRSRLYLDHGDWQATLVDLEMADRLAPGAMATDLVRGPALALAGMPEAAKETLDRFLRDHAEHPQALLERARVLKTLGQHAASLTDYRLALSKVPRAEPDLFHEVAQAMHENARSQEATQVLQRGIQLLGEVPSLVLQALEMETASGQFDAALTRVESMRKTAPRPEPWMAKRAELLAQAGRAEEARAAWQELRRHIAALPNLERGSHAMSTLAQRAALNGAAPPASAAPASSAAAVPVSFTTAPLPLPSPAPSR